jgi:peptide subunit release factor 1 (eRF1)
MKDIGYSDEHGIELLVEASSDLLKEQEITKEKAVEELVKKEKVIAIIGPLLSMNVEKAARKAQQLKVPLITLSQKEFLR